MCEPASFVVTKKQVFWSENRDSHEIIIEENKLKEMDVRKNPTFVRVEIVPPDRDYRLPFSKWNYKLDQDIRPEWYNEKDVEKRCRAKLKDWRKANVVMPNETVNEIKKPMVAVYGTIKYVRGGTMIKSVEGGTIKSVEGGTIEYVRGGTIKSVEGGTIKSVYGGTIESVYGDFPKNVKGNATIISYGSLTRDILKSSKAVLVDRSKDTVVCYVGKD